MMARTRHYVPAAEFDAAVAEGLTEAELVDRVGFPAGSICLTAGLSRGELVRGADGRIRAAGPQQLTLFGPVGGGARPPRALSPAGPPGDRR